MATLVPVIGIQIEICDAILCETFIGGQHGICFASAIKQSIQSHVKRLRQTNFGH